MRFDSYQFAIFFPIVVGLFWCLPQRLRWVLLLISSYYFYMCWRPPYAILLVLITAIDFTVGVALARTSAPRARRAILLASIASNLAILFVFKYYPFVAKTLSSYSGNSVLPELALVLPIGLSFHTFQSMGYAVDVYKRKVEPERHWGRFATFIVFFPQLVAGPIERAGDMLPQLRHFPNFDYDRVTRGLKLMAWGLFKKVVIADHLARLVDPIFAAPEAQSGAVLSVGAIAFGYQIYCDFSGYSDIAIGSAEVLGVRLSTNFRVPYHARNLRDFWTRWHISLSTWFRDYVYVPLGGNRVSAARWAFNILVVFALSGFWHGADWTFLVWGLYHGVAIIAGRLTQGFWSGLYQVTRISRAPRLAATIDVVATFCVVTVGWVFFRASTLHSALMIVGRIVTDWQSYLVPDDLWHQIQMIGWEPTTAVVTLAAIAALEIGDTFSLRFCIRDWLSARPAMIRWCAYYSVVLAILLCGQFNGPPFIYFQF
jgi:D-alanyl-lipoteichoic acid acyltransferase DltB (MBOAT superfamily)